MLNILITGGAGFIGTALAKRLKALQHSITIIDFPDKFSSEHNDFNICGLDIADYNNFKTIEHHNFDYIFHLAAQTSSIISQEHPELDIDTNVKGTLNVCNFARVCKAKKIIFTSSMATYGNVNGNIKEECVQNPVSNYGVSKITGEYYIKMYKQFGIENSIFRLFNVYGPGQDMSNLKQGMASIFMTQAIISNDIKVTGSFDRYRDFIYIDDVVDALILGLSSRTDSQIYNVGSGISTTVKELIDLIISLSGRPENQFRIVNVGSHEGDQFGSVANISKLNNLGWTAKVNLKDGLKHMYEYAKEKLR